MNRVTKTSHLLVILAALSVAGYYVYAQHQARVREQDAINQRHDALVALVKNMSLRVNLHAQGEAKPSRVTSHSDTIDPTDDDVAEIGRQMIAVQSASKPEERAQIEAVIAYLGACRDFLRAISAENLKWLEQQRAFEREREARDRMLVNTDPFARECLRIAWSERASDASDAARAVTQSMEGTLHATRALAAARSVAQGVVPEESLVDSHLLAVIARKNSDDPPTKKAN
jgi:hypothetical protein